MSILANSTSTVPYIDETARLYPRLYGDKSLASSKQYSVDSNEAHTLHTQRPHTHHAHRDRELGSYCCPFAQAHSETPLAVTAVSLVQSHSDLVSISRFRLRLLQSTGFGSLDCAQSGLFRNRCPPSRDLGCSVSALALPAPPGYSTYISRRIASLLHLGACVKTLLGLDRDRQQRREVTLFPVSCRLTVPDFLLACTTCLLQATHTPQNPPDITAYAHARPTRNPKETQKIYNTHGIVG